jgi:hypothetical protein
MTAAEAWQEVVKRRIALTPIIDGRLWSASADVRGETRTTRKRAVRSVSATSSAPIAAVESLCAKLDSEAQERALFEEGPPF